MFSGIVEELGQILSIQNQAAGSRLVICARSVLDDLKLGDSVSIMGVCLTAVQITAASFAVEAVPETLRRTKLGALKKGDKVNLERALKVSDRLGGHIVSGHVDGLAEVLAILPEGISKKITFRLPKEAAPYFIEKGSVTIDGVSLTVASLQKGQGGIDFSVCLIPHTLEVTTLGLLAKGDRVNIEYDVIAKYVANLLEPFAGAKEKLSREFLLANGFLGTSPT